MQGSVRGSWPKHGSITRPLLSPCPTSPEREASSDRPTRAPRDLPGGERARSSYQSSRLTAQGLSRCPCSPHTQGTPTKPQDALQAGPDLGETTCPGESRAPGGRSTGILMGSF